MKNVLIGGTVVLLIALVGIWAWKSNAPSSQESVMMEDDSSVPKESMTKEMTDWLSAISSGKALQCTYEILSPGTFGVNEQAPVKMFIQGKKYRIETTVGDQQNIVVADGQMVYSWSTGTKQGTKMDLSCMKDIETQLPQAPDNQGNGNTGQFEESPEDILKQQPSIQCESVKLVDLSIPDDVEFSDQCELMKQSLEMMKKGGYQNQIPENIKNLPAFGAGE